tara:strand:+ start:21125 stop:22774 length:1650 start_codon:yes stop_codon:yes gene_type:complete
MTNKQNEITTYSDAISRLASGLIEQKNYHVGSFYEFLRDIWSQSFDNPEYFGAWHVGVLAEDIEECLETGQNYVAVLPRFHFKSTIMGHAFSVWRLLKAPRDCSVLYLSYSDGMARYHLSEINKTVSRNPILTSMMDNRSPKADYSFRYYINKRPMEIMHGGLFSFKRGMHVNGALIADDVLRDPENPLNTSQITKVEDHFMTESLFIPLKGVPVVVLGTPMMPGDLLTKLQKDDRFKSRVLPALDPVPNRRVLMPELYNEEWLLQQQEARPKSFASEFLLQPHFATEAYFNEEEITNCEDATLRNHPASNIYKKKDEHEQLFAGFDVGKKRHPSHLVIFRRVGEKLEQVHQSWLDGWSYSDQIEYLNDIAKNFDLEKGYIDNTRGELEDRGLDPVWHAMHFTLKSKRTMAQIFEEYVSKSNLTLVQDSRQKEQIVSVSNELKAPETPMGHGDAFFSIAMALQAAYETTLYRYESLGSASDWLDAVDPSGQEENSAEELKKKMSLDFKPVNQKEVTSEKAPNPNCTEMVCTPNFWVPERKLCIYCGHRG